VNLATNFLGSAEWKLKFEQQGGDRRRIRAPFVPLRAAARGESARGGSPGERDRRGPLYSHDVGELLSQQSRVLKRHRRAADAFLLYATLLQRDPTVAEKASIARQLAAGTLLIDLIDALLKSPEFAAIVN
jgi:hypothetical protein